MVQIICDQLVTCQPRNTRTTESDTPLVNSYRAGDGNDASFKSVKVIVADHDIASDIPGVQNVWIERVGCGTANVNFSSWHPQRKDIMKLKIALVIAAAALIVTAGLARKPGM